MNEALSSVIAVAIGGAALASLFVLAFLFQRHIDGRPLLEYEPRRPVPWNFLPAAVMLAPLAINLAVLKWMEPQEDIAGEVKVAAAMAAANAAGAEALTFGTGHSIAAVHEFAEQFLDSSSLALGIWSQAGLSLLLAAIGLGLMVLVHGATPRDLGLPLSWRQLLGDIRIGATAFAASLAPVYVLMFALTVVVEPTEGHPLIQELTVNHSLGMMIAAGFTAVVAAPIYEELTFRLALQGWLERRVAERSLPANDPAAGEQSYDAYEAKRRASINWAPPIITGVLFGLAHYGHGVSPLPLMLFGVALGYLYQRTHRIVPSIVCHMMFNAFSLLILSLYFAAESQ